MRGARRIVAEGDSLLFLELVGDADLEQIRAHRAADGSDHQCADTMSGNGTCSTKIATNEATATASISALARAFLPMRIVAAATIAMTAGARPAKIALDPRDVAL